MLVHGNSPIFPNQLGLNSRGRHRWWGEEGTTRGCSPSIRWHLKLDGRAELERGRVQALHSVGVTAGSGGAGGSVTACHVCGVSCCFYDRSSFSSAFFCLSPFLVLPVPGQWIHRIHVRGRWWVWAGVGT